MYNMPNDAIKARASNIYTNNFKVLLLGGLMFTALNQFIVFLPQNFIFSLISALLSALVEFGMANFYFSAFINEKADLTDSYSIFKNPKIINKLMSLIIIQWLIIFALSFIAMFTILLGTLGIILTTLITIVVSYYLVYLNYVFLANPNYPINFYFKASVTYITLSYIGFAFTILIIPSILSYILQLFLSPLLSELIVLPLNIYVYLAIAGYITCHIPDEWYNGEIYTMDDIKIKM